MSDLESLYEVRDYRPQDTAFVMATFLKGLYYGDSWFSLIPQDIFMSNYKLMISNLLSKSAVKIACLKEDNDIILGYSVLSEDFQVIHWVFVKKDWRKQGISKRLLPQYPLYVTHLTALGQTLLPKFKDCQFNPFA